MCSRNLFQFELEREAGVPDTASTESSCPGTVGGGRRSNVEYEKAPWIEATVRSVLPEPSANMYDMWFYVNHGRDEMILCQGHYNGDDDEVMPTDQMRHDFSCGKECIACRASETMKGLSAMAARVPEKDDRENGGTVPCILQHHVGIRQSSDRPSEGLRAVPQGTSPNQWWATKDANTARSS